MENPDTYGRHALIEYSRAEIPRPVVQGRHRVQPRPTDSPLFIRSLVAAGVVAAYSDGEQSVEGKLIPSPEIQNEPEFVQPPFVPIIIPDESSDNPFEQFLDKTTPFTAEEAVKEHTS